MTARRHPSYTRPVPVDFARPDAPRAFAPGTASSEDPPYERHNHEAMLTMADRLLATRERRLPMMVRNGDITIEDARAQIATISAIGTDWHWIITGKTNRLLSTLAARRAARPVDHRHRCRSPRTRRLFGGTGRSGPPHHRHALAP
jgi:hypothetical protein